MDKTNAKAVAEKVEAAKPKWISVDERLPENMGHFLVYCESGLIEKSFYIEHREQALKFFRSGNRPCGYSRKEHGKNSAHFETAYSSHRITHWMPLPEPPEAT